MAKFTCRVQKKLVEYLWMANKWFVRLAISARSLLCDVYLADADAGRGQPPALYGVVNR